MSPFATQTWRAYATKSEVVDTAGRSRSETPWRIDTIALWLPAILAAALYPFLVRASFLSLQTSQVSAGSAHDLFIVLQMAAMVAAFSVPYWALRGLRQTYERSVADGPMVRKVMLLAFAAPPVYLLASIPAQRIARIFDAPESIVLDILWLVMWATLALLCARWNRTTAIENEPYLVRRWPVRLEAEGLRTAHRWLILVAIAVFLGLHLVNHLAAFWSLSAQKSLMDVFRLWYRAAWIEPIVLSAFGFAAATGLLLASRWTKAPAADRFRALQVATGVYVALFLVNHVLAILRNRGAGTDTNWFYATAGHVGLLGDHRYTAVFVYYVLAVLFVGVHAAMGIRNVLARSQRSRNAANAIGYAVCGTAVVVTSLIGAALLGVHLWP